ncbi:hypothetical protein EI427_07775 [Flammeovirga pectinis]|uniref:Uncharacterized protein n=1 Tax=Flammeovirga pectinis TaxID=2494373 RepID=A0A3Q9FMM4_9BACT|nr:hypothetical protein [Flammeovirga pectinis]AZQ62138.1 hypothetical protein EI427_07775 [Flammeovirga pectinis]
MHIFKKIVFSLLLLFLCSCDDEALETELQTDVLYQKKYDLTYSKPLKFDTFSAELKGEDLNSSIIHFKITRYDGVMIYEEYLDGETVIGDDEDLDSLEMDTREKLVHSRVDNYLQDKAELIIILEKIRPKVKSM